MNNAEINKLRVGSFFTDDMPSRFGDGPIVGRIIKIERNKKRFVSAKCIIFPGTVWGVSRVPEIQTVYRDNMYISRKSTEQEAKAWQSRAGDLWMELLTLSETVEEAFARPIKDVIRTNTPRGKRLVKKIKDSWVEKTLEEDKTREFLTSPKCEEQDRGG